MKAITSSLLLCAVLVLSACGGGDTNVSNEPPAQPNPTQPGGGNQGENPSPEEPPSTDQPPAEEPPTEEPPPVEEPVPNTDPYVIDYYGDSTIWGWMPNTNGARVETPAPAAFAAALPTPPQNEVRNEGVNGSTACGLLNGTDGAHPSWNVQMQATNATHVILNHGINDRKNYDVSQYRSCLESLAEIARANGKQVVFETPNPISSDGLGAYVQAMREVAAGQQPAVPVIDQHAFLLDYLDGASPDQIAPDGEHPNQEIYILKGEYAADRFMEFYPR